jgi:MSHA biogenesis protein MshP
MCPEFRCRHLHRYTIGLVPGNSQRGAGLPIALFIITVLALLVLAMAQWQQASGESVSLQIQSQRAFFAAESGAQVAVRDVLEAGSCSALASPLAFSGAGLAGCRAVLQCESVTADLGGTGGNAVFTITSSGQCGSGTDRAVRELEVRVR